MTLTRGELMRLNKQLAARGMKLCACCGRQLAIENFAMNSKDGRMFRRGECRDCEAVKKAAWHQKRKKRPGYHEKKNQHNAAYWQRNRDDVSLRRKRARLAAVLAGMTGELRTGSQQTGRE